MPIALLLIGLILIVAGVRNKVSDLGQLLVGDFSGAGNFFYWVAGLGVVGAIGYYPPLRNTSRLFLFLIILSMLLADKGFFGQLQTALQNVQAPPPSPEASQGTTVTDSAASGGSGSGNDNILGVSQGDVQQAAQLAMAFA